MARIPLGVGAYSRPYAGSAEVELLNRFFERNPANQVDNIALLSRPGSSLLYTPGVGPIGMNFSQPGLLGSDLFTVSGGALFRYDGTTETAITGSISTSSTPRFAPVRGAGYERIFIADGTSLQYYGGQAYSATLTLTPGTIADDKVQIDGIYYQFTAGSVNAGTPLGTLANPWLVAIAGSNANALANLRKAVNLTGVAGTDYSTATTINTRVTANANSSTTVSVRGAVAGALNPVAPVSVVVTGGADGLAWDVAQLTAGAHVLYGVVTPDSVAIKSVAMLDSFILCAVAASQRVYFIRPGETTIDALDFFEAESEPDQLVDLFSVGSQVWLLGQSSTEPWYNAGTAPIPFARIEGRPFARGTLDGSAVKLSDSVLLVGDDNIVYKLTGGPEPVSNPGISEQIRLALEIERA